MKQIFIVVARVDWEPDTLIRAYSSEEKAETFCTKCNKYQDKSPSCPNGDGEKEWDEWQKKQDEWIKRHPSKEKHPHSGDEFVIRDLNLHRGE